MMTFLWSIGYDADEIASYYSSSYARKWLSTECSVSVVAEGASSMGSRADTAGRSRGWRWSDVKFYCPRKSGCENEVVEVDLLR
jgi:hypothetical protein